MPNLIKLRCWKSGLIALGVRNDKYLGTRPKRYYERPQLQRPEIAHIGTENPDSVHADPGSKSSAVKRTAKYIQGLYRVKQYGPRIGPISSANYLALHQVDGYSAGHSCSSSHELANTVRSLKSSVPSRYRSDGIDNGEVWPASQAISASDKTRP